MTQVWVVETGDYEQRYVALVALSVSAAVDALKRRFAAPYRVTWGTAHATDDSGESFELSADFESVLGYSTKHRAEWTITPYNLG